MKNNFRLFSVGLAMLFAGVWTAGCATSPSVQRLQNDPRFQEAARQLATAYLEGQKRGDSGAQYGVGASRFYNLAEYKLVSFGWEWGQPAVFVRVKAGNQIGGNPTWENYSIRFTHNPQLEANGDPNRVLKN